MAKIDPQAQALVDEYVDCLRDKERVDDRLVAAKQKLLEYSQSIGKKTLFTKNGSVTVSYKNRTVFPKYNQPGRKELEAAVKAAGYLDSVVTFDVIKLAEACDDKRLPEKLAEELKPLARIDRQIRIFVNEPVSQVEVQNQAK